MNIQSWKKILDEFPVCQSVPGCAGQPCGSLEGRIKVVLFDIYGTLIKPLIGDLDEQARTETVRESFRKTAYRFGFNAERGEKWYRDFFERIDELHCEMREIGIIRSEVLVEKIWQELLQKEGCNISLEEARSFAMYRELVANPVASFQGVCECLEMLKERGYRIGIVSNSQFYSLPVLEKALGTRLDKFLDSGLLFLSFELGFAKPDPHFFLLAKTRLALEGVDASESVVVGNDWENDIMGALNFGFKPVFFGGENRDEKNQRGKVVEGVPIVYKYKYLARLFES